MLCTLLFRSIRLDSTWFLFYQLIKTMSPDRVIRSYIFIVNICLFGDIFFSSSTQNWLHRFGQPSVIIIWRGPKHWTTKWHSTENNNLRFIWIRSFRKISTYTILVCITFTHFFRGSSVLLVCECLLLLNSLTLWRLLIEIIANECSCYFFCSISFYLGFHFCWSKTYVCVQLSLDNMSLTRRLAKTNMLLRVLVCIFNACQFLLCFHHI